MAQVAVATGIPIRELEADPEGTAAILAVLRDEAEEQRRQQLLAELRAREGGGA